MRVFRISIYRCLLDIISSRFCHDAFCSSNMTNMTQSDFNGVKKATSYQFRPSVVLHE